MVACDWCGDLDCVHCQGYSYAPYGESLDDFAPGEDEHDNERTDT